MYTTFYLTNLPHVYYSDFDVEELGQDHCQLVGKHISKSFDERNTIGCTNT